MSIRQKAIPAIFVLTTFLVATSTSITASVSIQNTDSSRPLLKTTDLNSPFVTVKDAVNMENETEAIFRVGLSQPTNASVTISYTTVAGSAQVGQDYVFSSGYITIPAGQQETVVTVPLLPDDLMNEGDENFYLELTNSDKAVLTKSQYYATIVEDDLDLRVWLLGPAGFNASLLGMAVDSTGNAYSISCPDYRSRVSKFAPDGTPIWEKDFADRAEAIIIDSNDNIYVGGEKQENYRLVKYNPSGDALWERTYDGPDGLYDTIMGMGLDQAGNIYVTGHSRAFPPPGEPWEQVDIAILKYDPQGNLLWQQRYNSPNSLYHYGYNIAVDPDGNAYIAGEAALTEGMPTLIIKFSPEGVLEWETFVYAIEGAPFAANLAFSILIGPQGALYIAGRWSERLGDPIHGYYLHRGYVMSVAPSGEVLWSRFCLNGQSAENSYASTLALDDNGNVVLSCTTDDNQSYTIKYTPGGSIIWASFIPGYSNDLIVDASGNIYTVGTSNGQAIILQYDSEGKRRWQQEYAPANQSWVSFVRQSPTQELYVAGQADTNFFLGKFTPPPLPSLLGIQPAFVQPAADQVTQMNFTLSLSAPQEQDVTVHYETVDGTAKAGYDYEPISGTLTIPAHQTTITVTVPVFPSATEKNNLFFFVNLSDPINTNLGASQAKGAIWSSVLFLPLVLRQH